MKQYVAYLRVSTKRQGQSGLGLDAQRKNIADFINGGAEVLAWYEEHESGGRPDRPELAKALDTCELTGATLVVSTLDRLTRDVMTLETINRRCEDGGFEFRCADMPEANAFLLGVMAQVAQYERTLISRRTRKALAEVKKRIVRDGYHETRDGRRITTLGRPDAAEHIARHRDPRKAQAANRAKADCWAEKRRKVVASLVAEGLSNSAIARTLNERGIRTPRRGSWAATSVKRLRDRLAI